MNESEQAQAIAVKDLYWCSEGCGFVNERHRCEQWCNPNYIPKAAVKSIVDSQAQKIAEQAARISELEKEAREHVCCLANNGW